MVQDLKSLLKIRPIQKSRGSSERGELLEFFRTEINLERKGTKYPEISKGRISRILAGLTVQDLYYMKSVFTDISGRNGKKAAVKWVWWSLRPNNE